MCFERPVLKSLFYKASGLHAALSKKRLWRRCFPVKLLRTRFLSNISGWLLLEEHKILLTMVPIAILNDISKSYQKEFVIYFFWDQLTVDSWSFSWKLYNKVFSCSWIFSTSWASPNTWFSFSSSKLTFFWKLSEYWNYCLRWKPEDFEWSQWTRNLVKIISKLILEIKLSNSHINSHN